MQIKINFKQPEIISSGIERDKLVMEVRNPIYFFSKETLKTIQVNSTSEISIPKMLPNTAFAEFFTGLKDSSTDVTKVSILASFAVNMFMSGPMDLLWGLINSL